MERKLQEIADQIIVGDIPLYHVRNKNEKRVIESMNRVLAEYPDYTPNKLDVEDIYALSLNNLPPRYVQRGSIVLREPVRPDDVDKVVAEALETVRNRPNYDVE